MTDLHHRDVETNGITMHVVEAGPPDGPVVLLCHGFPESWYSWRHQLGPLAEAGYHVVAPDMRGYGWTDAPADPLAYTVLHHVGDLVGLLDDLGAPVAAVVGHDWGAPVAWQAATVRPDRFHAVAGLSVPWTPRGEVPPVAGMRASLAGAWFYFTYSRSPAWQRRSSTARWSGSSGGSCTRSRPTHRGRRSGPCSAGTHPDCSTGWSCPTSCPRG